MKTAYAVLITFLFLTLAGCSKDSVNEPDQSSTKSGKMLLKFNKSETPDNVATITASLIRTNFQTITGTLKILTDSTAEISMQNITAGLWHLIVEAKDNNGVVIYKGETDVNIVAGSTTQVMLTLVATGANVGSIYIIVNWGSSTYVSPWIDYSGNPILSGSNQAFDLNGVSKTFVLIEGSTFKMWYQNIGNNSIGSIGYAVSSDGINWTKPVNQSVLYPGQGTWDAVSLSSGPVIKVDNIYRMYYSGRGLQGYTSIGLATSTDGISWVKSTAPVMTPSLSWEGSIEAGDVIKINNTYYMYYTGIKPGSYRIGIATSTDGINWTRYSNNPVIVPEKAWEEEGGLSPTVIYDNNKYIMTFLVGKDYTDAFGMATSTDGINWVKDLNNPFFTTKNIYNNWIKYILYPCIRKYNNEWRLYYTGFNTGTNKRFIGMAKSIR